jgi:hypothetical protein
LQSLRDATIDKMYAFAKQNGTGGSARVRGRDGALPRQARSLSDDLLNLLDGITSSDSDGQILAAVAMIKMNVAPVIAIRIDFGKDNHSDPDLMRAEVPQTEVGVQRIALLMQTLQHTRHCRTGSRSRPTTSSAAPSRSWGSPVATTGAVTTARS